jgi:hypothetical protein
MQLYATSMSMFIVGCLRVHAGLSNASGISHYDRPADESIHDVVSNGVDSCPSPTFGHGDCFFACRWPLCKRSEKRTR